MDMERIIVRGAAANTICMHVAALLKILYQYRLMAQR
jgi:hypothetical protein